MVTLNYKKEEIDKMSLEEQVSIIKEHIKPLTDEELRKLEHHVFASPFTDYIRYNGQGFKIIREIWDDEEGYEKFGIENSVAWFDFDEDGKAVISTERRFEIILESGEQITAEEEELNNWYIKTNQVPSFKRDWQIVSYGITECDDTLYVIQKSKEYFCLWIAEGKPNHLKKADIEAYMASHDTEGYSVSGSYEEIMNELQSYTASALNTKKDTEDKLRQGLVNFITRKNEENKNTDLKIMNIRLVNRFNGYEAYADVSFTWYLNGSPKPTELTDVLFLYRNDEWFTNWVF